jgi:hypothetical protein
LFVANTASKQKASWKLEGDYFEGCNCKSICPCIFKLDPTEGDCWVTCAWHILKGNYDGISLDNLSAAAIFYTPGNMYSGPKWKAALYIDDKASPEQTDSIKKIYSGQAGGFFAEAHNFIGEMLGAKSVPIEFRVDGKRRWLYIKDSVELEIEGLIGADPNRESRVVNPSFSVVPGYDLVIARSTKYKYNDYGLQWDNSGKNGFYCRFSYSPQ